MEEKLKGTPNPLNPNLNAMSLDANPSEPMQPVDAPQPTQDKQSSHARTTKPIDMVRRPISPRKFPRNGMISDISAVRSTARPPMTTPRQARPIVDITTGPVDPVSEQSSQFEDSNQVDDLGVVTNIDGTPTEEIESTDYPINETNAPEEIKPENKKGRKRINKLFVATIVLLFVAIGCGIAAILLLFSAPKEDTVAIAANRLMSGGATENVAINGTIDFKIKDPNSTISDVGLLIEGEKMLNSETSSVRIRLDANLKNGKHFAANISEVYAIDGYLYLKIDGAKDLVSNMDFLSNLNLSGVAVEEIVGQEVVAQEEAGDAVAIQGDALEEIGKSSLPLSDVLTAIDDEWIKISVGDLSIEAGDNKGLCLINLLGDINGNSGALSEMYLRNPFITSAGEDSTITEEQDLLYQVMINDQNFRAFLDESASTSVISNLASCLDYQNATDDLAKAVRNLPEIYVGLDGEANFARLYVDTETSKLMVKVDLQFSYPDSINVSEPVGAKDLPTALQEATRNT